MSALKSIISNQFDGGKVETITVPEWIVDGEPAVFTFTRATVGEIARCAKLAENDPILTNVRLIALKLLHVDGKRVFAEADAGWIADNMDPYIVQRLGAKLGGEARRVSPDDQEKN